MVKSHNCVGESRCFGIVDDCVDRLLLFGYSCLQSGEVVGDSDAVERRNLVGSVILYQKRILTLLGHGMIACQGASGHNSG